MIGRGVWTRLHFIAVTTSSIQTPGTVLRATELIHLLAKAESIHTKGSVNSGAEIVLPVPGSDLRQRIIITSFLEFCTVSEVLGTPCPSSARLRKVPRLGGPIHVRNIPHSARQAYGVLQNVTGCSSTRDIAGEKRRRRRKMKSSVISGLSRACRPPEN